MPTVGYSGTPLPRKPGLKPDQRIVFVNAPPEFAKLLGPLPDDVTLLAKPAKPLDFAIVFAKSLADLKKAIPQLHAALAPAGIIWVSWPKKASKVPTDLTENVIREYGLSQKLVDIKVCAVSEIWSGLKFVIPVKDRK